MFLVCCPNGVPSIHSKLFLLSIKKLYKWQSICCNQNTKCLLYDRVHTVCYRPSTLSQWILGIFLRPYLHIHRSGCQYQTAGSWTWHTHGQWNLSCLKHKEKVKLVLVCLSHTQVQLAITPTKFGDSSNPDCTHKYISRVITYKVSWNFVQWFLKCCAGHTGGQGKHNMFLNKNERGGGGDIISSWKPLKNSLSSGSSLESHLINQRFKQNSHIECA